MRGLALVLILVLTPTLGWSAGGRITVVTQPPLRGSQPVKAPPLASALPTRAIPPAPVAQLTDPAADCRLACAQSRYFCDASAASDSCGSTWGQCTAACAAPNLAPAPIGLTANN